LDANVKRVAITPISDAIFPSQFPASLLFPKLATQANEWKQVQTATWDEVSVIRYSRLVKTKRVKGGLPTVGEK